MASYLNRQLWSLAALTWFLLSFVRAISPISVHGTKFFSNGQQFYIKGVAYQGTPDDPLVNGDQCNLDATLMKTIGTNSIRVYHVDPSVDHSQCMAAFEQAGIYVWLDLSTFTNEILQTGPTWNEKQFYDFTNVMDAFHSYDNLAGFWIGNEVIRDLNGSPSAPFIKAAVADMKAYQVAKGYRTIPIGYSAADIATLRPSLQNYLACGSDPTKAIDFFGLNSYEWCGTQDYQTSGYVNLQSMAANYTLPIFFSETGCNTAPPRTFADQAAIFGPDMLDAWSGSIVYEWVQETNNYGLVNYADGQIFSGVPRPRVPDFANLQRQWSTLQPTGIALASYTPTASPPACPSSTPGGWELNGDVPLPTLGAKVVSSMAQSSKPTPTAVTTFVRSSTAPASTATMISSSKYSASSIITSSHSTSSQIVSSSGTPTLSSSTSASNLNQKQPLLASTNTHPADLGPSKSSKSAAERLTGSSCAGAVVFILALLAT